MVCSKKDCLGCFACYNICKNNAISMKEDDNGFIYPVIDEKKCTNCKLCEKVCPAIKNVDMNYPVKCFAMKRTDDDLLGKSSSGGAASVFTEYILEKNGIVYGSCFDKNFTIKSERIDSIEQIDKLRGSKYVHSYINDCYKEVKESLKDNKMILFIGTPCQVAGLRKFLIKEYENLYTIDIICHGVPSQQYLKDELEKFIKNLNDVKTLKFRKNNKFGITINDNLVSIPAEESDYYMGFMSGKIYRENCYNCQYACSKRCSDITIGDFWGLKEDSKLFDSRENGVSVLLPITQKGMSLIKSCEKWMVIEERPVEEAIEGNMQLQHPVKMPKNYFKFKNDYVKYGFNKAFYINNKTIYLKRKLKKIKLLKNIYKLRKRK